MTETLTRRIADELTVRPQQVQAAVDLLDGGATVPFIARYRKEATGGLDDTQLRQLEERLGYLRELEERRRTVLEQIGEQGKLTPELERAVRSADTKQRLEDLYLPYRKKRRTRGQIAREAGLEPLVDLLLSQPDIKPTSAAGDYLAPDHGFADADAVLEGARHLLAERIAESADLVGELRDLVLRHGVLRSEVVPEQREAGAKFSDYFDYSEKLQRIPSHRALALFRGRREGVLRLILEAGTDASVADDCQARVARHAGIEQRGRAADNWLAGVARFTWRIKLFTRLETDLLGVLREQAEHEAIDVFARNLKDLLLASPAGPRCVMGIDPGIRTGCKVAVVDATGKVVETATIYPLPPRKAWDESIAVLAALCERHGVELVAIGNGTGSRETDKLVADLSKRHGALRLTWMMVSEAGASVYSASELAAREFPELDVSLRGAVSIARRLQDPLAELVKIDPKAIGVGQYQHDVSQSRLARSLEAVVEDCVNAVGVDLNTASAALLRRVSGLSETLAENLVAHRDAHGPFPNRAALKQVPRLGEKTFEQAAGFLRIRGGTQPLDASAVHPEAYPLVKRLLKISGRRLEQVIGDRQFLQSVNAADYTDNRFGEPTVRDILSELEKPGRDPRPEFRTASFRDGVEKPEDLEPGMILEGVVTNVTNFGAFVDVGVHQDGLVHISALSDRFVKDPREITRSGDVVKVKVMEVDLKRRRIGLSMRLQDALPGDRKTHEGNAARKDQVRRDKPGKPADRGRDKAAAAQQGALAAAFSQAKKR
ncbi:uncharacterized protein J2T57_000094 [Natronocella acetinitrilica]|uniref:S1 motif domain-containing protein n=1 Tax=Natronocella acetinitrilica TaxID=414046 RepID=A0AAE3G338_9GAMM|nr:Tex family protein [Natronocella acetinitrilica]MCP1673002.1 uncharacterized protein [Natronocella acetinitrilica]